MSLNDEIAFRIDLLREIEHHRRTQSDDASRKYYQTHLYEYIIEKFDIRPEEIYWSKLPEYANHKWEGTSDPLLKVIQCVNEWKWCGVESAKGVGKTHLGAKLALSFFDIWENSIVVTFAPKEEQLKLHLWKEIGKIYHKFNKGRLQSLKLYMKPDDPQKENWAITGFGVGAGAVEQVALNAAGFHGEHVLIILEETSGINQKIIDSIVSTLSAPHNVIVAFGNPDHQLDNLHKFCKLPNVEHIRISGFDHPNVVLKNPDFIPGAQSEIGLQRLLEGYGSPTNPLYLSHAKGISPGSTPESLIQMEWIEKARVTYDALLKPDGQLDLDKVKQYNISHGFENEYGIGVDVANSTSGDLAAKTIGIGVVPYAITDFPCPNSNSLGDDIHKDALEYQIPKSRVKVDGVGVGSGTVNTLILNYQYEKTDIDFQGAATPVTLDNQIQKFNNLRSQAWWTVREGIRLGVIPMPYDPETIKDLVAPKWSVSNGLTIVESKKDIKKRLGHSPNRGDSFIYWYWNNVFVGTAPLARFG